MKKTFTRLPTDFWQSAEIRALNQLDAETKLLAMYLLTSPHTNMLGIYYLPLEYASLDTGLSHEPLQAALNALIDQGFCEYDEVSSYIWVCELAYYRTGGKLTMSDKQTKGVHTLIEELPDLPFLSRFYARYTPLFHLECLKSDSECLPANPLETPSEPLASKKKNKKKQKKKKKKKKKHKHTQDACGRVCVVLKNFEEAESTNSDVAPKPYDAEARKLLQFFNKKAGRAFRAVDSNLKFIISRLQSGVTVTECQQVIAKKTRDWKNHERMDQFLRPETVFDETKFEQYLGELVLPPATDTEGGSRHE